MTTIAQIVRDGKGYAGSQRSWRVHKTDSDPFVGTEYELWHYSTLMLRWIHRSDGNFPLYMCTGHGSVSDQGGMNTAFKVLGLPLRFDRAGGADIVELEGAIDYTTPPSRYLTPRPRPARRHRHEPSFTDAMRWTPEDGENEIAEWRKILSKGGD